MGPLKLWTSRAVLALIVVLLVAGLAYSFPLDLAFLLAIDLATWVEAAVAVYVAAQVTRIRPLLTFVRARLFTSGRRSRRRRTRLPLRRRSPSNDDGPAPALALAA